MGVGASKKLAEFVAEMRLERLPREVVEKAKLCVLDTVGVALAGSRLTSARVARAFAVEHAGEGSCTIIGSANTSSVVGASFANSQSACALDLDDGHYRAVGHAGACVIPSALAVAEAAGASGKSFLEAVVAGYETSLRIAASRRPEFIHTYASGPWVTFGACYAAGKLLGLSADGLALAADVAGCHAPVRPRSLDYQFVPMLKECIGWAGLTGVSAAYLGRQGFTGLPRILEYDDCYDQEALVAGLGSKYEILDVTFKRHSSCAWTHAPIDGAIALKRKYNIRPEDVIRCRIGSFERASIMTCAAPETSETAQYSIRWCVASALKYGKVGPDQVAEEALKDKEVLELASRVSVEFDEKAQEVFPYKMRATVQIETRKGVFETVVEVPKADADNPMTPEEVETKFRELATQVVGDKACEEVHLRVTELDELRDVRELTKLLKTSSG